jgi:hypothetical protein
VEHHRDGQYYPAFQQLIGQPIGNHFCTDDVLLRAGENEVIAGGAGSPFVSLGSSADPTARTVIRHDGAQRRAFGYLKLKRR